MKRVPFMSLVILMFLTLAVLSRPAMAADASKPTDADFGVRPAEERVLNLPQDQKKFYLTLFGDPSSRKFTQVTGWFESYAKLNDLKKQTHFNVVTTDSEMYKSRYAASTATVPCVRLQDGEGTVLYQVSGENIPLTAASLYRSIADTECLRRRCRPAPEPTPQPEPAPPPDVAPEPQPEPTPPDIEDDGLPPLWLMAALLVAGAGAGCGTKYYETYYGKT